MKAFCWRSGEIGFGRSAPYGTLTLVSGRERRIRSIIEVVARHAYDGVTLLVPGVPEADDDAEALRAVDRFISEVKRRDTRRASNATEALASSVPA